jgi:hypothetical protein
MKDSLANELNRVCVFGSLVNLHLKSDHEQRFGRSRLETQPEAIIEKLSKGGNSISVQRTAERYDRIPGEQLNGS